MSIRIRRGTNAERLTVVLEEGEFGYTTDTKKVYIGDGVTLGGNVVTGGGIGSIPDLDQVTTQGNTTLNTITVGGFTTGYALLDVAATPTLQPGMFAWNDIDGTADLRLKGNNVTLQIGEEIVAHVVNKTGADLLESEYKVVRVRIASEGGSSGQKLAVVLAQGNNDPDSVTTLGIVTEDIANNQEGFITILGNVNKINTTGSLQGETWVDGDVLYLSPTTPGALTKVKPVAPQHTVTIGYVLYSHPVNGKIFVKVDNGYELDELHNVLITSVANNDLLQYDSTQQVWKNVAPSVAVPTPTLAQVTTAGNTTTNAITVGAITATLANTITSNVVYYNSSTGLMTYGTIATSTGTVTSVDMTVPTGLSISGNPITTSGTLALTFTAGYSIPTTTSQTNWDTAYTNRITSLTTTGSSGASTLISNTLNIPNYTLAGLGGQPLATNLTSLSGLSYVSTSFVKMTAAGTFTLDTNTYYLASNPNGYTSNTGTVTSVDITLPTGLSVTGNPITTSGTLAVTFTAGYSIPTTTSQTDWDTAYTNRITSLTTTGSSGAATLISNTLNIPNYTLSGLGGVPTTRTLTINGTSYDLSADRSWTVTAAAATLDAVTTAGNTTTNSITVGGLTVNADATINTVTVGRGNGSLSQNVTVGGATLTAVTTGDENTVLGYAAANQLTTGAINVFIGKYSGGLMTSATGNVAVGANTLGATSAGGSPQPYSGSYNTAIGNASMRFIESGLYNTGLGSAALYSIRIGIGNTAVGYSSLSSVGFTTGDYNTAVGFEALTDNTESNNVAVGYRAGYSNTTGTFITAIGFEALLNNTGSYNTALGYQASRANTTGAYNTAIGVEALSKSTSSNNTAVGYLAGRENTALSHYNTYVGHRTGMMLTVGEGNTGMGSDALGGVSAVQANTAAYNTAIGRASQRQITTGSNNTSIGNASLYSVLTGSANTSIGAETLTSVGSASNNTAVGYRALNSNTTSDNVAVGYSAAYTNSTGTRITVIGWQAAYNTTASNNTVIGYSALSLNTSGAGNTMVGKGVASGWFGNINPTYTGSYNTAVGGDAMYYLQNGSNNASFGWGAMYANRDGNYNVGIGPWSLQTTNGNNNTALGYQAGSVGANANTTGANNIFIGYQTTGVSATESNRTWIGNASTTSTWLAGNLLVGTTTDGGYKAEIAGTMKVSGVVTLSGITSASAANVLYYDSVTGIVTYSTAPTGGGSYTVTNVSSSYVNATTSGTEIVLVDTTSGTVTITLPSAVGNTATLVIKKVAGNSSVVLDGASAETIDGGATATIVKQYESVTLVSNNSNWLII